MLALAVTRTANYRRPRADGSRPEGLGFLTPLRVARIIDGVMAIPRAAAAASKTLGETLLEAGVITPETLALAEARAGDARERLGDALVELGAASEEDVLRALAAQRGLAFFSFGEQRVQPFLVLFRLRRFRFGARQFGLGRLQLTSQRARFFPSRRQLRFQLAAIGRPRSGGADQHQRDERAQQRPGAGQGEEIRLDPSRRQEPSRLAPRPHLPR